MINNGVVPERLHNRECFLPQLERTGSLVVQYNTLSFPYPPPISEVLQVIQKISKYL